MPAQESRTATKTRTLLSETPQAVSVVTRKLIEDEVKKAAVFAKELGTGKIVARTGQPERAKVLA